ncbi:MAG: hypothetical protein ABEI74_03935 [Candidatus Pacearchaeota archaeon]
MNFRQKKNYVEITLNEKNTKLLEEKGLAYFKPFPDTSVSFYLTNKLKNRFGARVRSQYDREYVEICRDERCYEFYIPHSVLINREDIAFSRFRRDLGNLFSKPDSKEYDNLEVKLNYPERIHQKGMPRTNTKRNKIDS